MKVIATAIKDVVIIEPQVFGDDRGYFFELLPTTVRPGRPARTLRAGQRIQIPPGRAARAPFPKGGRSPIQTGTGRSGSGSGRRRRYTARIAHVRQTRRRRADRQESPPALRTARIRTRFFRIERRGRFPIQMRQLLRAPVRRSDRLERPRPGDRLATPRRRGDPLAQRPGTSPPQRCRRTFRLWNRLLCITYS